jgi:hypothetical protein
MFSTRNNSSDQKIIEKFNDESPKSVKRINGLGWKNAFDYPQLVLYLHYLLNIGRIVTPTVTSNRDARSL